MSIQGSLKKLRTPWMQRIINELAQSEDVRAGLVAQLERFYNLLEQAVASGDGAWLDPILYDWGHAPTETDLEDGAYPVSFVMNRIITLTMETARENLRPKEALEFLGAVIPIFTYSLSVVVRYEMETRVAHISRELERAQNKMQELDRSKSRFISVAAHELKTPLTLIEGYSSMMADLAEPDQQNSQHVSLLKGVNTGISRLRRIIDDMIDVSLIDNNLLTLNFQPVWVSHLIKLLQTELATVISNRKQKLIVPDFEGRHQMIYGDTERLYQALHNVVTNAIKYTPDEGVITISGRLLPGFVEVTVEDTGIGIPPEYQNSVFEKFGQLGRADLHSSGRTKFKGGGPGLGLPIARGIIEAHGGTIWISSEGYDEVKLPGTTVHILLPIREHATSPEVEQLFGTPEDAKQKEQKTSVEKDTPANNPSA